MADTVAITFEYKAEDFVLASRWVIARNPRTYISCLALGVIVALIGLLVWWYNDQALGLSMMLASPAAASG